MENTVIVFIKPEEKNDFNGREGEHYQSQWVISKSRKTII